MKVYVEIAVELLDPDDPREDLDWVGDLLTSTPLPGLRVLYHTTHPFNPNSARVSYEPQALRAHWDEVHADDEEVLAKIAVLPDAALFVVAVDYLGDADPLWEAFAEHCESILQTLLRPPPGAAHG